MFGLEKSNKSVDELPILHCPECVKRTGKDLHKALNCGEFLETIFEKNPSSESERASLIEKIRKEYMERFPGRAVEIRYYELGEYLSIEVRAINSQCPVKRKNG